jgi:amino acid adenylation domain-containing protein
MQPSGGSPGRSPWGAIVTTAYLDGLPAVVRDLDAATLLRLPVADRLPTLTTALGAFYDHVSNHEPDEDEDEDGGPDPEHPLILESAVAAEMNVAIEGWLGVAVPIESLLLDGLSLRELARRILVELSDGDRPGPVTASPVLVADPAARHDPFELSDIQQAYWIGRDPVYELGGVSASLLVELRVTGFDVERATRALAAVVDRHDMLRSVVGRTGVQQVLPVVDPPVIEVRDLRPLDTDERASWLAADRERLARRRTAPERPEPFEIHLLRLDDDLSCLMMSVDMVKLDAWSVQLLLAEWFHLYDNPDVVLPEPQVTFRDYVGWTVDMRSSASYAAAKEYWTRRVPTLPPAPELPLVTSLDTLRHPTFSARSARIPRDRWTALKAAAADEGLTPSMMLCAAYAEVLGTWSTQRRFTLSVAGGRPPAHAGLPRVLGPFARPTMLEVDLTADEHFLGRARALQRRFSQDMEHRQFGGLDVLRELAASSGRTRATMPVIFTSVLPQAGEGGLPRPAWLVAEPYVVWGMPQLLLENQMIEVDGDLLITWVAADGAFADGVVDEMFRAYEHLLERAVGPAGVWSDAAPVGLPDEHARRRPAAEVTSPPSGLLHDPFAEQVRRRPGARAVTSSARDLTYAELDRQADHVAAALARHGVTTGELVAVCMDRGWEQVAAVLGVLRSGAAYVPLDPELPARRMRHLLEHTEVRVALVQGAVESRVDWPDTVHRSVVEYDDGPVSPPASHAMPEDLAYVIFTSGSTGVPKGVMIEHRAALNTVLDVNRRFEIGADDRVLALSALSFDLSVHDILGTLAAGAAVVIPDAPSAADPGHWWDLVERERVTVWNSVPALMQLLVAHRRAPAPSGGSGSIRKVLLSGDWIPVALPGRVVELFPAAEVISLGGATEASIWSVFHPVRDEDATKRSVPYGLPLTHQRLYVLDDLLEPRPDMVAGDLYIAGAGLARGYWRDAERTAASFLDHPRSGERLYRTGDKARFLADGEIEFLGREDAQVKVNGHRIELGEIEAALHLHPAVDHVAAAAVGDAASGRGLVAQVVLTDRSVTPDVLVDFVASHLPAYAVPRVRVVDALPLTPNGKIDRDAVGRASPVDADLRLQPHGDDTPTARLLADILADLLGCTVGVHDDVYDLGANSLVAIQLAARAEDAGIELNAADVLTHPTAAALAGVALTASAIPGAAG